MENIMTVKQIASVLKTDIHVIYKIINEGQMKYMKLGGIKVRESEFNEFVRWLDDKDVDMNTGKIIDRITGEVVTRYPEKAQVG